MGRYTRVVSLVFLAAVASAAEYTLVDVQKVPVDRAIHPPRSFEPWSNEPVDEVSCDVLIAGAGMGGVGAALAVARHNKTAA